MADPKIAQKGPYIVEETAGTKAWCSCGHSAKQPYCDGAHSRLNTGMKPMIVNIEAPKKVAWCGCKHTAKPPFCDGAHTKL
ncbi:MAG: CDGSH iron-sulfur domain-containing protein [Elusimicrobia bacterium]|nr:CDGSH iron-sulfur domain-containing protein [Elusimicrobiota bacterium]